MTSGLKLQTHPRIGPGRARASTSGYPHWRRAGIVWSWTRAIDTLSSQRHIEVKALTHVYGSGRSSLTAIEDVDLEIEKGAFASIVGPSGGGKTTLLKAIGGLLTPTSGSILVEGRSPREAQARKAIGFVFQDASLLPWRTVEQNIRLPLELNANGAAVDTRLLEQALEGVGLADFRNYSPHQISGGMAQRVSLARALVFDPAVLLMDEPLGALDEITRTAMRYEVLKLWERSPKTVLMVTHSIPEAVMLSDWVVVMSSRPGRILKRVKIELPRPRAESLEHSALFLDYVLEVKEALSSGVQDGQPVH